MNNLITCIILMIFLHIVDDYYLQGILASMKQKSWWRNNSNYTEKYKYDYIVALFMHSFSWSFMIILPILYILNLSFSNLWVVVIFLCNMFIHCFVDNLKANLMKINLVQDQTIHIIQIIITSVLCCTVL